MTGSSCFTSISFSSWCQKSVLVKKGLCDGRSAYRKKLSFSICFNLTMKIHQVVLPYMVIQVILFKVVKFCSTPYHAND